MEESFIMLGSFIHSGKFKTNHPFDKVFIIGFVFLTWIITIWGFTLGIKQIAGGKSSSVILYAHIIIFFS